MLSMPHAHVPSPDLTTFFVSMISTYLGIRRFPLQIR
ncbi:hypothetical protein DR64_7434 [Paraburkholderia xenovorans LB400]|nr:hypothetical protein DR64_7434 [Paraburkholderia xenovorans LB400]